MLASERQRLNELLARLAKGDRNAFDPVFDQLWPVLSRYCVRYLSSEAEGQDAAQNALMKIFNRASDYEPEREALNWALAIATWECRTLRRKTQRKREVPSEEAPENSAPGLCPELAAHTAQLRAALDAALSSLPARDRDFLLADLQEAGHPGIKPATVRKRRQRAIMRLRNLWSFDRES